MFSGLIELFNENIIRAVITTIGMIVILSLLCWVSIIDIKKKSVTFWKMIVVGASIILMPFIESFFAGCWLLPVCLFGALILWFVLLYLNVKFNKDKFVGKADVDLLMAVFSELVMYSIWMLLTIDLDIALIQINHLWYSAFLYLLIGSLIFMFVIFLIFFIKKFVMRRKDYTFRKLIKETKVSVIPMLVPVCLIAPYMIMVK